MYKYYCELDKPNDYKVYLKRHWSDRKQNRYVSDVNIPPCFIKKYEILFQRIDFIDMLIEGSCEEILYKYAKTVDLSYEQYMNLGYFFDKKDEEYHQTKLLEQKLDFNGLDLENLLRDYYIYCNCLSEIYPDYKEFIFSTSLMIQNALGELEKITTISIPPLSDGVVERFPNAWYITPSGYLYNTGLGHKEGNLVYPFYYIIKDLLKQGKNIPNVNKSFQISNILQRGYVTSSEFDVYANLINEIPTILTPEVEHAIQQFENIIKMDSDEKEKITTFPHYRRTYQKIL